MAYFIDSNYGVTSQETLYNTSFAFPKAVRSPHKFGCNHLRMHRYLEHTRGQNTIYGYESYFEQILAKIAPIVNFTIDQYLLVGAIL